MRRPTLVAMALLLAACSGGAKDRLAREAAAAGSRADSALGGASDSAMSAAVPSGAGTDTGAAGSAAADTARAKMAGGAKMTAGGAMRLGSLSADQIEQLQTALNDSGCKAGPVDGIVGSQTRQGIACAMKAHNISAGDMRALYRSLNLNFGS